MDNNCLFIALVCKLLKNKINLLDFEKYCFFAFKSLINQKILPLKFLLQHNKISGVKEAYCVQYCVEQLFTLLKD